MTKRAEHDLIVVGGGPGGYTAAIRAAQLGLRTVLVERDELGGTCGNWGCIPSKALISSAELWARMRRGASLGIHAGGASFDWGEVLAHSRAAAERSARGVAGLVRRHGVEVVRGTGTLAADALRVEVDGPGGAASLRAPRILLAVGGRERLLPGIEVDRPWIVTSRELLEEPTLPGRLVVIGGGAVGVELGWVLATFGVEVTIVELATSLLPGMDLQLGQELGRAFGRQRITVHTGTTVQAVRRAGDGVEVEVERAGERSLLGTDRCLLAVGREPLGGVLGLDRAGVELDRGWVKVGPEYQTSRPGVFAVGDVIATAALAHVASKEAVVAVEKMVGLAPSPIDSDRVPVCVYAQPEVAGIGLTEQAARERGFAVKVGVAPYRALGRANASDETTGLFKVVTEDRVGEILGCHVVGAHATEMIGAAALALGLEATVSDLGRTMQAHPTYSEGLMEAALAAMGEAINL